MEQRKQETVAEAVEETAAGQETSEPSLEEALEQLTGLLEALDGGNQTLEEAFASYKKGIELVRLCSSKIDKVEKQCRVIAESGEEYDL